MPKIDKRTVAYKSNGTDKVSKHEKDLDFESLELICNVDTFLDIEKSGANLFYLYKNKKMTRAECMMHQKFLNAHADLKKQVNMDFIIESQKQNNEILAQNKKIETENKVKENFNKNHDIKSTSQYLSHDWNAYKDKKPST